jgi:DNA invertase Pin-like site-specific DNA recombinase
MPPRKKPFPSVVRNVALCYVRLSYTRDENDKDSPERQRANIQLECDRRGWTSEWYQDAEGHKSGQSEKNRPGWLALKARLGDPDVVAIVANDLARLHRKGWRVGDLIDFAEEHDVQLVMAAPGRNIDLSGPMGRMSVMIAALMDEYYAVDISRRAKDSIAHRKRQGKLINILFGTRRKPDGFLEPTEKGAWWLPDGHHVAGNPDEPPDEGAVWRGYYQCAERILRLYIENYHGWELLAYQMNIDGWAFRDRNGKPRPLDKDDVRRVVRSWPEYVGLVLEKSSKKRNPHEINLAETPLVPERAVFDIDLLLQVGKVLAERSSTTQNRGVRQHVRTYVMNGLIYCAHCERLSEQHKDANFRTRLRGRRMRYNHKEGVYCGCTNRSVTAQEIEGDFGKLIKLLTVREDALSLMTEIAIQADKLRNPQNTDVDPEAEKREAIAHCNRKIDAAINLYGDGVISREEYLRRVELNKREIAYWEARTTESEKAALELAMCMQAVDKLAKLWDAGDDEDKQGMARSLFSYIVYDLDTRRIVDFRLKPWADRFLWTNTKELARSTPIQRQISMRIMRRCLWLSISTPHYLV